MLVNVEQLDHFCQGSSPTSSAQTVLQRETTEAKDSGTKDYKPFDLEVEHRIVGTYNVNITLTWV